MIDVMHQAEDLENLENLHSLCSLMQTIRESRFPPLVES
jgi:protein phosphatase 4 regulatory subunit 3